MQYLAAEDLYDGYRYDETKIVRIDGTAIPAGAKAACQRCGTIFVNVATDGRLNWALTMYGDAMLILAQSTCTDCHQHKDDHADTKCLFGPGHYQAPT